MIGWWPSSRQLDLVVAPVRGLVHDLFGLAAGVDVGGVDHGDPGRSDRRAEFPAKSSRQAP